jgi:hypothetical protein
MFELRDVLHGRYPGKGQKAIEAISALHGYPYEVDPISISEDARLPKNVEGDFRPPGAIRVSGAAKNMTQTLLHEMGHAADYALGGGFPATHSMSPNHASMRPVVDAIERSAAFTRLFTGPLGGKAAAYWGMPIEAFARAYAQWVSMKRNLPAPHPPAKVELGTSWDPEDFQPIMDAIDAMFEARGLLK